MLNNKKGFLLIESLLLLEIVLILSFVLVNCILLFSEESNNIIYDANREDTLVRKAYE